jgi:hypothetical protein
VCCDCDLTHEKADDIDDAYIQFINFAFFSRQKVIFFLNEKWYGDQRLPSKREKSFLRPLLPPPPRDA